MFSNYRIEGDTLYIDWNYQYAFAREFSDYQEEDLRLLSRNYLNANHIPFKGDKVCFLVDGKVLKEISLSSKKMFFDPDTFFVILQLEDHSHIEIPLREYLTSILLSYYSPKLGEEVLKCLCVLFNTYAYKKMAEDGMILANTAFAYYFPSSEYKSSYSDYPTILQQIHTIITECSCQFLSYQNEYILPFIHYANSGRTLTYKKYPYLTSVKSLWDLMNPDYISVQEYSFDMLSQLLKVPLESHSMIHILNHGYSIKMNYKIFSMSELKDILHLKSNDITIIVNRNSICFITRGYGNGLGLSLYGASSMEKNGSNYISILHYYFPKCQLLKNIKELSN